MSTIPSFNHLPDAGLVNELRRLVSDECRTTAHVVAALAEFDARRLWLPLGYSSLFAYCVQALHLSEDAACSRIDVARASRKFPKVLECVVSGDLSLTAARMLAPHLSAANHARLLEEARHKTKREIELLLAKLNPQPPVPTVIRKLPDRVPLDMKPADPVGVHQPPSSTVSATLAARQTAPASIATSVARRTTVAPLSESQYKLQVTISRTARERLRQIQDLMRHRLPNGDAAAIVEHALEVLHRELLKQKAAEVVSPRSVRPSTEPKGRYIPAAVKRAVWRRDHGRCAFVSADGRKCDSTSGLEFHHKQPYARSGGATEDNLEMRCRAHNGFEWELQIEREGASLTRAGT